ncbi:profilin-2-like isoform X1 [Stegastes partitus]|uniref:Profilin n=1 Tax=Stegastes partitus TaxID=144197 RepID=A0A9Y4N2B6_9TELE|nr:PREDICTED: profilin-2-like isoform X1 [Stegastes partitus]
MSWQSYVDNLMADGDCQDSAIVGYTDSKYVWGAYEGGIFGKITSQEIDALVGKDRETFHTNGLTLGAKRCSVLRDSLFTDGDCTMDIRTKSQGGEATFNISVGRAEKGGVSSILFISLFSPPPQPLVCSSIGCSHGKGGDPRWSP